MTKPLVTTPMREGAKGRRRRPTKSAEPLKHAAANGRAAQQDQQREDQRSKSTASSTWRSRDRVPNSSSNAR